MRKETVPGHRWERERGDHACTCAGSQVRKREETACTCAGSQVGKRERRLYLYLCWVTGGKARKETVPVPVLGHRWESEKEDRACTCAGSQVGNERKETVPVPVPGQSAGLIPDSSAHCVRCHSCRPGSEDSIQLTLYSLAPTLLQLLYNKHFR